MTGDWFKFKFMFGAGAGAEAKFKLSGEITCHTYSKHELCKTCLVKNVLYANRSSMIRS